MISNINEFGVNRPFGVFIFKLRYSFEVMWRHYSIQDIFIRLLRILDLASNPNRHRAVVKILTDPSFISLILKQPQITTKYLNPNFLIKGLTTSQRSIALTHHYSLLKTSMDDVFIREMLFGEIPIWEHNCLDGEHAITLSFSHPIHYEGELTLSYKFDGSQIYLFSFTIIPGHLININIDNLILVTRIQGPKGNALIVRRAAKSLNYVAPQMSLLATLQGFAMALQIDKIAFTSAERQSSYQEHRHENFYAAYDGFINSCLQTTFNNNLFLTNLPFTQKSILLVKRNHRSRTTAKREIRRHISETAFERTFRGLNRERAQSRHHLPTDNETIACAPKLFGSEES
jgi:uncharacterized protein VirK/YbjX